MTINSLRLAPWVLAVAVLGPIPPAAAINLSYDWGRISINTSVELGLQWRMQDRADDLVGKSNLNPTLCEASSCQGHTIAPGELGLIGELSKFLVRQRSP